MLLFENIKHIKLNYNTKYNRKFVKTIHESGIWMNEDLYLDIKNTDLRRLAKIIKDEFNICFVYTDGIDQRLQVYYEYKEDDYLLFEIKISSYKIIDTSNIGSKDIHLFMCGIFDKINKYNESLEFDGTVEKSEAISKFKDMLQRNDFWK